MDNMASGDWRTGAVGGDWFDVAKLLVFTCKGEAGSDRYGAVVWS